MDPARQNRIRCQRVSWLLQALRRQLQDWQDHRRQADRDEHGQYVGRHATQLEAVGTLLDGSLEVMAHELSAIDVERSPGEVFSRSRQVADAVVWLERVWRYFAQRFDQRDATDPRASLVAAADEVVWSCYRPFYENPRIAVLDLPRHPPPLAYVEPEYSPAARIGNSAMERRLEPSLALEALDEVAGQLPIPLLQLPPWCLGAPWWLVFIAHEVGHQLQHELQLVEPFRLAVEEMATASGAGSNDVKRWGRWGQEIFADQVSLCLMGPWALWALIEVEQGPTSDMARRRRSYPSPVVRLRCMARSAQGLGLDTAGALRGVSIELPADATEELRLDMAIADELAALVQRSWAPYGKLAKLLRFDATDYGVGGDVERWASRLLSDQALSPPRHLDTARRLIAASVAAWAHLGDRATDGDLESQAFAEAAASLAQRTIAALRAAAPPGFRSATMPRGDSTATGRQLAGKLLTLAAERRAAGEDADGDAAE